MKLASLIVENIRSYRDRTSFVFTGDLNILVGPNAGGKTNILRILTLGLSNYLFPRWRLEERQHEWHFRQEYYDKNELSQWLQKFHNNEHVDSVIEFILTIEPSDVANLSTIYSNRKAIQDVLNRWGYKQSPFLSQEAISTITETTKVKYTIRNGSLQPVSAGSAESYFLTYLQNLTLLAWATSRLQDVQISVPILFLFERALGFSTAASIEPNMEHSLLNEQQGFYAGATGGATNDSSLAARHFAIIRRDCKQKAAKTAGLTEDELFYQHKDVIAMKRYMMSLGYEWDFLESDQFGLGFRIHLKKDGRDVRPEMFSSGEAQIVNIVVSMFMHNTKDGLVVIDEPELHLHARWQSLLLDLLQDAARVTNNQIIMSTHSPVFISPETVRSVVRVYSEGGISRNTSGIRHVDLDTQKLLRMLNSHNNEKIFFADAVVLVEGLKDRLVFQRLIDSRVSSLRPMRVVEVVEVLGSGNLAAYQELTGSVLVPTFIVADFDYIALVGGDAIAKMLKVDNKKLTKVVFDKKSVDRRSLVDAMDAAISSGVADDLNVVWNYVKSRSMKVPTDLSTEERELVNAEIRRLETDRIYILKHGEIEDYLLPGKRGFEALSAISSLAELRQIFFDEDAWNELNGIADHIVSAIWSQDGP